VVPGAFDRTLCDLYVLYSFVHSTRRLGQPSRISAVYTAEIPVAAKAIPGIAVTGVLTLLFLTTFTLSTAFKQK
jgi:hypothetical protein